MKQSFFPNYSKSIWLKLALVYLLNFNGINQSFSQPSTLYTSLTSTSPAPTNSRFALNAVGGFRQFRFQATASVASGLSSWAFSTGTTGAPTYNPCWRPTLASQLMSINTFIPTSFNNGAIYQSNSGNDGQLPAITNGNYYTFNVSANAASSNAMSILETSFNPNTIASVLQYPASGAVDNNQSVTVRITLSNLPFSGENFYVRYSTNGFSSSTLQQFTFNGNVGLATIPALASGTNVAYYIFSSNKNVSAIGTDVTSYGQAAYDMATLNLNNNSGSNYSYSVATAGGPLVLYTGLSSTTPSPSNSRFTMNYVAGFRQVRFRANQNASASSTGWAFHTGSTVSPNYNPCYRPYSSNNTLSVNTYIPTSYSNGAKYNTGGGGSDGLLPAITSGNYYTFNVTNNATGDNTMQLLETNYNPVSITSLTQSPGNFLITSSVSPQITINTSSAPASGEYVFLRYSANNFVSSSIVQFSFSGSIGSASIPAQAAGTNLSYYIFSSNKTSAQLSSDVTTFGQIIYDMATLNLLNNSNMNYNYTVQSTLNAVAVQSTGSPFNDNSYSSLYGAFTSINGGLHTGNITIAIGGNLTETISDSLNASGVRSANYNSISIYPTGGAMRTITSSGFTTLPLIDLNGADRVTIDGLNTGGNGLTISNPSTNAAAMTIRLYNDACRNIIRNCTVLGSNTSTLGAPYGTIHLSTGNTTGNDSNVIANNLIGDASGGLPSFAIYSHTNSSSFTNDSNIISGNQIYNYFSVNSDAAGIYLMALSSVPSNTYWTITNNRFYQTATRNTATSGNIYRAIRVGNSTTNVSGGGHTISNNIIGFNNAQRTGTMTYGPSSPSNYAYRFIGIDLYLGNSVSSNVIGNTIAGISLNTTSGAATSPGIFSGIALNCGLASITNDTVGYTGAGISLASSTPGASIWGIYASESAGSPSISDNYIGAFSNSGTASSIYNFTGIQVSGVANSMVSGNVIGGNTNNDISIGNASSSAAGTIELCGLSSNATGAVTLKNNVIRNLTLLSQGSASTNLSVLGIKISGAASNTVLVSGNKVYNLRNAASSSSPISFISGIVLNGTQSGNIYNNMISLNHAGYTSSMALNGISISGSASQNINAYYNSIYIGGSQSSGSAGSRAMNMSGSGFIMNLRNNLFFNERSGGSGLHGTIDAVSTGTLNSNYNLHVASGTKMGSYNNNSYDFTAWKSVSGQDYQSYDTSSSALNADSLFLDKSNGDLQIKADRTAAWYVNGKGVAGTLSASLASDFSGDARSTTYGFGTDIGADEFNATSLPPLATVSGNIAVGDSTNYTFANRTIAKIKWKASTGAYGTNLPNSIAARYYTGATPPDPTNAGNNTSAKYMNSYWTLTPSGGSAFRYNVTLYYDEALLGTVSGENNLKLGKKPETGTGTWKVHYGSFINTTLNTIQFNDLNGFSVFTGSDGLSPLPVQLGWFNAFVQGSDAVLNWETITEQNADKFVVLRSISNGDFEEIGTVQAGGNSVVSRKYQFLDKNVAEMAHGKQVHYMLRMLDLDGTMKYSDYSTVQFGTSLAVSAIFPQPTNDELNIMIQAAEAGKVNLVICDLSGKILLNEFTQITKGNNQILLNTASLSTGVYLLRLNKEHDSQTYRILKK